MGIIEGRLTRLGITLEPAKSPVANYLSSKRSGDLLFVSARVSELNGEVGKDVTEEEAKEAARKTVLLLLSIIKNDIKDLDLITGVVILVKGKQLNLIVTLEGTLIKK